MDFRIIKAKFRNWHQMSYSPLASSKNHLCNATSSLPLKQSIPLQDPVVVVLLVVLPVVLVLLVVVVVVLLVMVVLAMVLVMVVLVLVVLAMVLVLVALLLKVLLLLLASFHLLHLHFHHLLLVLVVFGELYSLVYLLEMQN